MARSNRKLAPDVVVGRASPGVLALVLAVVACGSSADPADASGGASGIGGGTSSGGTSSGGGGNAGANTAGSGVTAGVNAGGSAGSGNAGRGGTAQAAAGAAGSANAGAGAAAGGGSGGVSGAPQAGGGSTSGGAAGTAAGGSAGAATGTAAFEVEVELASDVDPDAPTTVGIVTWTVDVASLTQAHIEFGLDTTYGMNAPVDLALADHRTLLLGMKPEHTYHFRVVASDGTTSYASTDHTLETGAATTLVPLESFEVLDEAARERGFIIASYWQGMGNAVPFVLDADGDIVWWFPNGPNGIARARMSADGKNMWMISPSNTGAALQRVSMDGLDAQTYNQVIGSHDLTPVSGETMAFLEYGEDDCNSIYEIDPSGTTREVFESDGVVGAGMCHGNAVRYSQAEDVYTYSEVSQDVFAINRDGDVEWKLSELVPTGNDAWGGVQHGHQLMQDSILIFANNGGGQGASAAIEYSLSDGAELLRFASGDFSQNLGDVQRLPGGNTLITFSNDSIIKEIDAEENVVLEINGGGSRFGYALWTESLYDALPDVAE